MRRLRSGALGLGCLLVGLVLGYAQGRNRPAAPHTVVATLPEVIDESSGLVGSRTQPGIFWTHNDSGGAAELFAIDALGTLRARVAVDGGGAVDWEAIAADERGRLFIADSGNNAGNRRDLEILVVPEPRIGIDRRVEVLERWRFHYPDQQFTPDEPHNFDAEALFWAGDRLYLWSKHRADTRATLYRFPAPFAAAASTPTSSATDSPARVALERLGSRELALPHLSTAPRGEEPRPRAARATAAAISRDERWLALLAYHAVLVFEGPDYLSGNPITIDLDESLARQCEAIAWDGSSLLFTNEQREIHRIPAPFQQRHHPPEPR